MEFHFNSNFVHRLRSCEAAYGLLEKFANSYQAEVKIIEDSYQKLNNLTAPKSQAIEIEPTKVTYAHLFSVCFIIQVLHSLSYSLMWYLPISNILFIENVYKIINYTKPKKKH